MSFCAGKRGAQAVQDRGRATRLVGIAGDPLIRSPRLPRRRVRARPRR
jgi:hypothetical protein